MESLEAVVNRVADRAYAASACGPGEDSEVGPIDVVRRMLSGEVEFDLLEELMAANANLAAQLHEAVLEGQRRADDDDDSLVSSATAFARGAIFVGLAQAFLVGRWLPREERVVERTTVRGLEMDVEVGERKPMVPTPLEASGPGGPAFESAAKSYRPAHGGHPGSPAHPDGWC